MPSPISEIHSARKLMLSGNAREALERLAGMDFSFATLSIVRGECHYVLGNWEQAVEEFKNALRLSPNSPRPEIMLILAHEMLELERTMRPAPTIVKSAPLSGEKDAFKSQTTTPVATDQPDEIGLVSETLATLMVKQGKLDEARKVYIQLARLNPDRYEYFRDRIEKLGTQE